MHKSLRSPKVFVPNRSGHDFTSAERYGELVYLTEGSVNRFQVANIMRDCQEAMKDAAAGDFILISSLSVINSVACALFAYKFGRLNLLQFDNRKGITLSRSIVMSHLQKEEADAREPVE